jgi:aspartate carbamoyltransferase catalytic subunit
VTQPRHLLGIEGMTREEALRFLDTATAFWEMNRRAVKKVPTLRGKTVINVFFESSTRTRTSFELAGKRLSADVVNLSVATSSTGKGEDLKDTARTLDAMAPDILVVRHAASGVPHYLSRVVRAGVINAGDGLHEHPTQALLDAFTMRRAGKSFEGLKVVICGDIAHSRVARSNFLLLQLLGAQVRAVGPSTLLPREVASLGVEVYTDFSAALAGADVVMMLRIQNERLDGALIPGAREYSRRYGLNRERLALAAPGALVMHPGPMNRGVEIADDVADGPGSVILDQVEAGVAVRMATLYLCVPTSEPMPAGSVMST